MFEPRNKIWIGKRRQGKTLAMVRELVKALKHGIPVYSNIIIRYEDRDRCYFSYYISKGEDFFNVMHTAKNAIIAADEIGLVFPNQYWSKLPLSTLALFKESGHIGIAFWGTTHTQGDVVGKLRSLIDDLYYCNKRRWFIFGRFPTIKFKALIKAIFIRWRDLFPYKTTTPLGKTYTTHKIFGWTPAYVFHESQMNPSYKGDGGPRQYYKNLIRKRKMYPSEYVRLMKSYDTKQMIDYGVLIRNKTQAPAGKKTSRELKFTLRPVQPSKYAN